MMYHFLAAGDHSPAMKTTVCLIAVLLVIAFAVAYRK